MQDPKILLGKVLQRFKDQENATSTTGKLFGYIRETDNSVLITREDGNDTSIPFSKLLKSIELYHKYPSLYTEGPSRLGDYGITHIYSPIWALLHLLNKEEYA
ncbi:hypothetical protein [Reichenbachiella sp.]|uniref:hypothetical protein n=1 Tax=Reichenbachiella sp. TaxID=2184521 RepID=UPI0032985FB3